MLTKLTPPSMDGREVSVSGRDFVCVRWKWLVVSAGAESDSVNVYQLSLTLRLGQERRDRVVSDVLAVRVVRHSARD